jgi:hypothetical protein
VTEPPPPRNPEPASLLTTGRKASLSWGGGVALGTGVVFEIRSNGYEDDDGTVCPMTGCADSEPANELLQAGRDANVGSVAGGGANTGAAALWFHPGPERPSPGCSTSRATIARRLAPARDDVVEAVRARPRAEHGVDREERETRVSLLRSPLELSLSASLREVG